MKNILKLENEIQKCNWFVLYKMSMHHSSCFNWLHTFWPFQKEDCNLSLSFKYFNYIKVKCIYNIISSYLNTKMHIPPPVYLFQEIVWCQVKWKREKILNYLNEICNHLSTLTQLLEVLESDSCNWITVKLMLH